MGNREDLMPYPELTVEPMRAELRKLGFTELKTPEEVDREVSRSAEPMLLVVNSVCGCAAGVARPGVALSLKHPAAPRRRATVFAGQDTEATARARSYFEGQPPTSPHIAILGGGKLLYLMQRQEIEGRSPNQIAQALGSAYERIVQTASA